MKKRILKYQPLEVSFKIRLKEVVEITITRVYAMIEPLV